jgi:hypothetical protein
MVAPDIPAVKAEIAMLAIAIFDFSLAFSRTYT